jgi:uncharacterized protein involved in exopolysaccharide biosynthesis
MTGGDVRDGGQVSLFALATILVRRRWLIVGAAVLGGVLALLSVIGKPAMFVAYASFLPQNSEAPASGLSGIASQFGVSFPRGGDLYAKLLSSHTLLRQVAHDTIVVPEMGGGRLQVMDVLGFTSGTQERREEQAINKLLGIVNVSVDKTDGMVSLSVPTEWRSVSLGIVTALIKGVNDYNERVRQSQAASERKFVEGRLAVASTELRASEDRLEEFLRSNRDFVTPQLAFQRDRLQRDVTLRQQIFNSLSQSYEDVRIREVRVTPVITIFEPPTAPLSPESRGRPKKVVTGAILGTVVGILLAFIVEMFARTRHGEGGESHELAVALSDAKRELRDRGRWFKEKVSRQA